MACGFVQVWNVGLTIYLSLTLLHCGLFPWCLHEFVPTGSSRHSIYAATKMLVCCCSSITWHSKTGHSVQKLVCTWSSRWLVGVQLLPSGLCVPALVSAAATRRCAPSPPAWPEAPTVHLSGSLAQQHPRTDVCRPPTFWSTSQRAGRERLRHTWQERGTREARWL